MRILILLLLICFAIGCHNPKGIEVYSLDEEFELKIGERAIINSDGFIVEFMDVPEDSRCPINVACVWAGNGEVQIQFAKRDLKLNTYLSPKDTTVSGVNIKLLSLEPYPEDPVQIDKKNYKVRLLISKE